MRLAQPKSLATKTVVWSCASAPSIHYNGAGRICAGERCGWERVAQEEQGEWSGWFDSMCPDGNRAPEHPKQSITVFETI
jgi:hypothetical protein